MVFAYIGRGEWRGFVSSLLASKIFKAGEGYKAQVRLEDGRVLSRNGFGTLGSAQTWAKLKRVLCK